MYCFDKESGRRLTEGWDWITIEDGMLVVSREDGYGLLDGDGNLLLQPEYKYVDPIPDHDLVIVKKRSRPELRHTAVLPRKIPSVPLVRCRRRK